MSLIATRPTKPTGRKPGGQKGHEGSTLKMTQAPDETEDVWPNYCTKCGTSLEDCERILDYVTQVVSIPELRPIVKEIRHYITVCKQCVRHSHSAKGRWFPGRCAQGRCAQPHA